MGYQNLHCQGFQETTRLHKECLKFQQLKSLPNLCYKYADNNLTNTAYIVLVNGINIADVIPNTAEMG